MSPPLPIPSKAAIHALRGLALGTSCAIGVIVEDRRRRICTLRTAVANKEKIKSSRKYHRGSLEHLAWQLEDPVTVGHDLQIDHHDETTNPPEYQVPEVHKQDNLFLEQNRSDPLPIPKPSSSTISQRNPALAPNRRMRTRFSNEQKIKLPLNVAIETDANSPSAALRRRQKPIISAIENGLASKDEEGYGRAVSLFLSNFSTFHQGPMLDRWLELSLRLSEELQGIGRWEDASQVHRAVSLSMLRNAKIASGPFLEKWLALTAALSKELKANARWEDASQVLASVIDLGPLDEAQYLACDPLSVIEFHLQREPDTQCSVESLAAATKLFLAPFKESNQVRGTDMERIGRLLIIDAISLRNLPLAKKLYLRVLGWTDDTESFVRWAIHTFFKFEDHKFVVKMFLFQYSYMTMSKKYFKSTLDLVVDSVVALAGSSISPILTAFARMECPENQTLRTKWIMKLMHAHWSRYGDLSKTMKLFRKNISYGLLDRVLHPHAVHCTMVDIATQAGDEDMAHSLAEEAIRTHPRSKDEISLRLALFKAKAGEWDCVLDIFHRVRLRGLAQSAIYNNAFLPALKIFAASHSATETRDFAIRFVQKLDLSLHPYMVTMIAKKYVESRDMEGFMAWLLQCRREGFAIESGFCNSILHNCSVTWKMSFPELRTVQRKLQALNPNCSDEVTQRILSQSAYSLRRRAICKKELRFRTPAVYVTKTAYWGRCTDGREIFEAMNQKLMQGRPVDALSTYKRAMQFGMPFSGHCLRLAVLATLRCKGHDHTHALSLIQDAHAQGHEVGLAVATFIRHEINGYRGKKGDVMMHMRNLVSRFESAQIAISTKVLTFMATKCIGVGDLDKAIALCHLARDRSGSSSLCFSIESFKVLATAYSQMMDIEGMKSLLSDSSSIWTDKIPLLHVKEIRRYLRRREGCDKRMMRVVNDWIHQATEARAEARAQGRFISQETLRIVGDALANLGNTGPDAKLSQMYACSDGSESADFGKLPTQLVAVG